ncbi:unnamed protein product [Orchesella dallaii]|uniref:Thioredoxin domain-containing protein 17 n=1 Tax=Orchesella dallaii TaxID=48710 RepID=A0ABP1Q5D2_9HEXA
MVFTDTEVIDGYENFQKRVATLEDKKSENDLVIFLFEGDGDANGESWCLDCREFEKVWKTVKTSTKLPDTGCLIRVRVGPKEKWKGKDDNPFKKDAKLKLTSVPTMIRWGTPKRLSGPDLLQTQNIMLLFE